ncbi:PilZ domain-containing protein [Thiovibrio sp. JS02]
MAEDFREKRKHARVYFSPREEVQGVFVFPDLGQISFSAQLLDLSLGGLNFSLDREGASALEVGSVLILTELRQGEDVLADKAVSLVVRWVLDHPVLRNVSFGCEFQELAGDGRRMLEDFVAIRLGAGINGNHHG